ncbi:MAG TPA: hypothetical protein VMS54_14030 [Vicinamibacterales bacterium]|nr:hypothetical protein [Vicinamibacterales bacterium]
MFHRLGVIAATVFLCWPAASSAQSVTPPKHTRVFGAYSVNADYVENVPFAIIVDQPVSPFVSHGSGPFGFEASIERALRGHVGVKASVSGYFDPFRGTASRCQPPSVCAVSLAFEDDASAMYFTAGPVITARENKRTSLFAHMMVGAVRSSSTFRLTGTDVQYVTDPTSLPDTLILVSSTAFGQPSTLSYTDHFSDVGFAATLGGGFDVRVARRFQFRTSIDWNPTFLSRPKTATNTELAVIPSERRMQSHLRISLGLVWQVGR